MSEDTHKAAWYKGKTWLKMSNIYYNSALAEKLRQEYKHNYGLPTTPYDVRIPGEWVWYCHPLTAWETTSWPSAED